MLCVIGLAGCMEINIIPAPTYSSEFAALTRDRSLLEADTGTILPSSATEIHGYVDGFRDVTTHMRFQIPSGDLPFFLNSTSCTAPLSDADIRRQLPGRPDWDWWTPEKAESYGSCTGVTEHMAQLIFIDMTDPQKYVVYVIASTR